jgi:hypothetical protein
MIAPARIHAAVTLMLVAVLLLAAGCKCRKCEYEQERVMAENGPPEEIELVSGDGAYTETWFYQEKGYSIVFFWRDEDCSCDVRSYSYELPDAIRTDLVTQEPSVMIFPLAPRTDHPFAP